MANVKKNQILFEKINPTTYRTFPKGGEVEIVVGDEKQPDFKPRVKLKKWRNEVNLSVGLIEDDDNSQLLDGKILWQGKNKKANFYHTENGFEFEVILEKKPESNILPFSIRTKGLDFFYQPPLTEEEKLSRTINRPPEVIGSYAVYHKDKKNNFSLSGGENYQAGKAFHIFRPKIFDADGRWAWGELKIDEENELLLITIPQSILDNGKYPLVVDPNFGVETIGGTSVSCNDVVDGELATLDANAVGTSITAALTYSLGTVYAKFCLYDSSHNKVTNGETGEVTISSVGWKTSSFLSAPSLSAADYVICLWGNGDKTNDVGCFYDSGTATEGHQKTSETYGTWAASYAFTHQSRKYSIYCTFEYANPNVNDNVNVSEGVTLSIPGYNPLVSVLDSISVSESVTSPSITPKLINIFDSTNVSEGITVLEKNLVINVFDSIAISEYIGGWYPDTIYIRESIIIEIPTGSTSLSVSTYDSINVSENVTSYTNLYNLNVYDFINVSEETRVTEDHFDISVHDSVLVTENIVSTASPQTINVNDGVSVYENINGITNFFGVNVYDPIGVSEDIAMEQVVTTEDLAVSVSDGVGILENIEIYQSSYNIDRFDGVSISENIGIVESNLIINVYDSVGVSENINVLEKNLIINIFDSIGVGENINNLIPYGQIDVYNRVVINEDLGVVEANLLINVNDSVAVSDDLWIVEANLVTSIYDEVRVSEDKSQIINPLVLNIYDSVNIVDDVSVLIPTLSTNIFDGVEVSDDIGVEKYITFHEISVYDEIWISDGVDTWVSSLTMFVTNSITVSERLLLHYRGLTWYFHKHTVFMTERSTEWKVKNNTSFQNKNSINWYNKNNSIWKETNE